jgi:ribosomal protein S18 acetylase RimI-like enzyme
VAVDDRWWGARARLQVSAWRHGAGTVVMTPVPDRPAPAAADVRRELEALAAQGVQRVLTGALHHGELRAFAEAGFVEHERLHLLRHDLRDLPSGRADVRLRRAWRRDLPEVLAIDAEAFEQHWTLDRRGIDDAVRATPTSRFRVAVADGVAGYAITGRAMERGYLQRLAVAPAKHRQGIGTALVADGLRWLRRNGATAAVVNTQESNAGALELYEATGFVREPRGLTVLVAHLAEPAR